MNYINRFISSLKGPRLGPSPQIRVFIQKYGNNNIVFMNVCREPIQEYILKAANLITLGGFNKKKIELNYDKLFHLYLLISLENNVNFKLEKNEIVQIKPISEFIHKDCMTINVPINEKISFSNFLNNGIKSQGMNFWLYDAIVNNCQRFVNTLLKSNNLGNEKIYFFC